MVDASSVSGDITISSGTRNPKEHAMPTMQARFYEDAYPIGRLVLARARALALIEQGRP
jgi:hypothetical protein